jgi:formylmethanofuran dehydrogenase subunit E
VNHSNDRKGIKKATRDPKDKLVCEQCGRPVKIEDADDLREEILCATCALEYQDFDEDENNNYTGGWT